MYSDNAYGNTNSLGENKQLRQTEYQTLCYEKIKTESIIGV